MSDDELDDKGDLGVLLEQFRASGNSDWELFQSIFKRVERIVRKRLYDQLGGKIRPSDIAQSAIKSWLGAVSSRESDWEGNELDFFRAIILRKMIGKLRYFTRSKRDIRRETETNLDAIPRHQEIDSPELESIAHESETLIYDLIKEEPDEMQTAIMLKLFEQWSNADVLEYLNSNGQPISLRTLQLRLAQFKARVATRLELNLD